MFSKATLSPYAARDLRWHFVLIIAICVAAFANTFDNSFVNWDDDYYIHTNQRIKDVTSSGALHLFDTTDIFRQSFIEFLPLRDLSYLIDYGLWGYNVFGYHLGNLVFHTLCCLALYVLVLLLWGDASISLLAGLLFAVHPVHVESVAWIACRKDGMFLFFALLSASAYVLWAKYDKPSSWYVCALALFVLSLLCKAMPLTFPILLFLLCIAAKVPVRILSFVPFCVISAVFLLHFVAMGVGKDLVQPDYGALYALPKVLGYYLLALVLPFPLCQRYDISIPHSLLDQEVLLPASLFLLLSALLLKRRGAFPLFLWICVALIPVLNFVPFPIMMADRYLYLPSVGAIILAALFFREVPVWRRVLIVLSFLAITISHNGIFQNSKTLWADVAQKYPNLGMAYANLAAAHAESGETAESMAVMRRGLAVEPNNAILLLNMGNAYARQGSCATAKSYYLQAATNEQVFSRSWRGMGTCAMKHKDYDKAEAAYLRSLSTPNYDHRKHHVTTYYNLAFIAAIRGNRAQATSWLHKALSYVDFALPNAVISCSDLLVVLGEKKAAVALLQRALAFSPQSAYESALERLR